MRRDFKHRAATPAGKRGAASSRSAASHKQRGPRQRSGPPPWPMFGLGLLVGVAVGVAVMLFDLGALATKMRETKTALVEPAPEPIDDDSVIFTFYDELPVMEVALEEAELETPVPLPAPRRTNSEDGSTRAAAPVRDAIPSRSATAASTVTAAAAPAATAPSARTAPPAGSAPPAGRERYVVQVASFRKAADAETVRAKLGFLGLRASVIKVSMDGGKEWHRVRLGPVQGEAQLRGLHETLKNNGFEKPLIMKIGAG